MSFTKVSVAGIGTTGTITFTNVNVAGVITATSFSGSGANLTGLAATANVTTSSLVVIGVTTVTAGSVSAPSITPTGDTNTGIFFPSADTIAFGEGGSEAARIDSSGRFGIGTTSPNTLLHLETSGTGNSEFTIKNNNASPGSGRILFADQGASDAGVIQYEHDVNAMVFKTNTSEGARIDSSGNLKFNSGYGSVATAYGCRAWVNFDGTSGSIGSGRASGNCSSITDNGTGDYTFNFSTNMVDANYCAFGSVIGSSNTNATNGFINAGNDAATGTHTTSAFRFITLHISIGPTDYNQVQVAVIR